MKIAPVIRKLKADITQEAKSRAFKAANALRSAELEVLRGQRTGRVYRKPHTKRATYRASAPGEAPAVRSGHLRMSWRTITGSEKSGKDTIITPAIHTTVPYAPILQNGFKGSVSRTSKKGKVYTVNVKLEPRPFDEPIKEKAMPAIIKIFETPYLNK